METAANHALLLLLAKEWELKGPPGVMDVAEAVSLLSFPPTDVLAAVKDLFARGLVDMNRLKTSVFLTPEGYEAVEALRGKA